MFTEVNNSNLHFQDESII